MSGTQILKVSIFIVLKSNCINLLLDEVPTTKWNMKNVKSLKGDDGQKTIFDMFDGIEENGAENADKDIHDRGNQNMQVARDLMITNGSLNKNSYKNIVVDFRVKKEDIKVDLNKNKKEIDRY